MGYRDMFNGWLNANPATSKAAALALLHKNGLVGRRPALAPLRKPLAAGLFLYYLATEAAAARWRPAKAVEAEVLGSRVRLYPAEFLDCAMLRIPQHLDYVEVAYLQRRLPPGGVFLDIGAYIGFYALAAARAVGPAGMVIAVEAAPETFRRLQETVATNGLAQVRPLHLAVSDRAETRRFMVRPFPWRGASTLWEADAADGEEVACRPLLDILREQGVQRVDGAKLDIEGYEYPVLLRFFEDAPEDLWPAFVITEQLRGSADRAGGDAVDLLRARGYRVAATNQANFIMERQT